MEETPSFLKKKSVAQEVLTELANKGKRLRELQFDYLQAEEELAQRKKDYDIYRCVTLPNEMRMAGVTSIGLEGGGLLLVKQVFHCSPNKNAEDRAFMSNWLREHGGDHLIKEELHVASEWESYLQDNKVPHAKTTEFNTTSVKAYLKDITGANDGIEQIPLSEVPNQFHFIAMDECEVKI